MEVEVPHVGMFGHNYRRDWVALVSLVSTLICDLPETKQTYPLSLSHTLSIVEYWW